MEALTELLDELKRGNVVRGHFLGLLHVFIGRRLSQKKSVISTGLTWRELANLLQKVRWDPEAVRELGVAPDDLPPRDRQRYWYSAIARAAVHSREAQVAGDRFAALLKKRGYEVSRAPGAG